MSHNYFIRYLFLLIHTHYRLHACGITMRKLQDIHVHTCLYHSHRFCMIQNLWECIWSGLRNWKRLCLILSILGTLCLRCFDVEVVKLPDLTAAWSITAMFNKVAKSANFGANLVSFRITSFMGRGGGRHPQDFVSQPDSRQIGQIDHIPWVFPSDVFMDGF